MDAYESVQKGGLKLKGITSQAKKWVQQDDP